ncbi:hypothetical protein KP509_12G009800 [Ceratopteris richardii]|uniref:Uncharacterized protein n=1 Tax=Ceratopteris richardii TaxID=49495 RepID=A0A8T2TGG9_CERRI|nr:hypothetical protein KP509_12G009800 [Ceratopteris richardii]
MADHITQMYLYSLVVYFSDQALASMDIDVENLEMEYDVEEAHWLVCFLNQDIDVIFHIPWFERYLLECVGCTEGRYYYFDSTQEMPNDIIILTPLKKCPMRKMTSVGIGLIC